MTTLRVFLTILIVLFWGIMICGCSDDNENTEPNLIFSFSGYYEAGVTQFCWSQVDTDSNQVDVGLYQAYAIVGDSSKIEVFQINSQAPHVPSVCGTTKVLLSDESAAFNEMFKSPGDEIPVPVEFDVDINDVSFAPGDTVSIEVALPTAATIELQIRKP